MSRIVREKEERTAKSKKKPFLLRGRVLQQKRIGGDLLSHQASLAVPSALRGLTSVFGMGTGVTLSLLPPKRVIFSALSHKLLAYS